MEDNGISAHGPRVELFASYRLAHVRMYAALDELFGAEWSEAQFATTSRLRGEPADLPELHCTPSSPRTVQIGVDHRF